jgi:hypothetical protein
VPGRFYLFSKRIKIIIEECSKLVSKSKQAKARKGDIDGTLMAL